MFCMPTRTARTLQLNAIVEQPLTPLSLGRISCVAIGLEPIHFQWRGPQGKNIQLDATRSEAYGLSPGRYHIQAEAADHARAEILVDIAPAIADAIAVNEFRCIAASSGVARDGSIQAIGHGLDRWTRFLWSNGVETKEAVLRDARPGWYSMVPLPVDGNMPVFVQYCRPALVEVAQLLSNAPVG
jgi:hypothetical protein